MGRRRPHIVGVGESQYTRWGKIGDVTEHALACQAIQSAVAACNSATSSGPA